VPAGQLVQSPSYAAEQQRRPFAQADAAPRAWLYDDAQLTQPFMQISFNTRLPVLRRDPATHAIEVATPAEGPKWLSAADATVYRSVSAMPYPRDADAQALDGGATRVATHNDQTTANLQAGDILFYATDNGTGSIFHDAMYIGNGQMIEAYGAGVPVRVTSVRFGTDYWGAVRYLHS
jgi:cell wall-associated NlpC family hydrolase